MSQMVSNESNNIDYMKDISKFDLLLNYKGKLIDFVTKFHNKSYKKKIDDYAILSFGSASMTAKSLKSYILLLQNDKTQRIFNSDEVTICLNLLEKQLIDEDFYSTNNISNNFMVLKQNIEMKEEKLPEILNSIFELINSFEPLDIPLMIEFIEKAKEASQQISHKDVVLLLGNSRAGKSTLMHVFGGSKFHYDSSTGYDHYEPYDINPQLQSIIAKSSSRSVTRYIKAVQLLNPIPDSSLKDILICDTPGFEDTDGEEIDISNGLGLVAALQGSKSIRPLLLIPIAMIDRQILDNLKKLFKIISELFHDFSQTILSIQYVITQCEKELVEKKYKNLIPKRLETLINELSEEDKNNHKFVNWLQDMQNKLSNDIYFLIPREDIDEEKAECEKLWKFIEQMRLPISNPRHTIQYYLSQKSNESLTKQLTLLKDSLFYAMNNKHWPSMVRKLHIFQQLQFLNLPQIEISYSEALTQLEYNINDSKKRFIEKLQVYKTSLIFQETIGEDIYTLFQFFYIINDLNLSQFQDLPSYILHEFYKNDTELYHEMLSKSFPLSNNQIVVILDKLQYSKILWKSLNIEMEFYYDHMIMMLNNYYQSIPTKIIENLTNLNYDEAIKYYLEIENKQIITLFSHHIDLSNLDSILETIHLQIEHFYFVSGIEFFQTTFQWISSQEFTDEQIEAIRNVNAHLDFNHQFKKLNSFLALTLNTFNEKLQQHTQDILNEHLNVFAQHINQFAQVLSSLQILFANLSKLQDITFLSLEIMKYKNQIESMINKQLLLFKDEIDSCLSLERLDAQIIFEKLNVLKLAQDHKLDLNTPTIYQLSIEKVQEWICLIIERHTPDTTTEIKLEMFEKNIQFLYQLQSIHICDNHLPTMKDVINQYHELLCKHMLQLIKNKFHHIYTNYCDMEYIINSPFTPTIEFEASQHINYLITLKNVLKKYNMDSLHNIFLQKNKEIAQLFTINLTKFFNPSIESFELNIQNYLNRKSEECFHIKTYWDSSIGRYLSYLQFWRKQEVDLSIINIAQTIYEQINGSSGLFSRMNSFLTAKLDKFYEIKNSSILAQLISLQQIIHNLELITKELSLSFDFDKLLFKTNELIHGISSTLEDSMTLALENNNFKELDKLISEAKASQLDEKVKLILNRLVDITNLRKDNLQRNCNELKNSLLTNGLIQHIIEDIQYLNTCFEFLETYQITLPTIDKALEDGFSFAQQILSEKMLEKCNLMQYKIAFLLLQDFKNAIDQLNQLDVKFWRHQETYTLLNDCQVKHHMALYKILEDKIELYKNYEIQNYINQPPNVLWEQMQDIPDPKVVDYNQCLIEMICGNINEYLNRMFEANVITSCQEAISTIENLRIHLPKPVSERLETKINEKKIMLQDLEKALKQRIDELQDIKQWNSLTSSFYSSLQRKDYYQAKSFRTSIDKVIKSELNKFINDTSKKFILVCTENIPITWTNFMTFINQLKEILSTNKNIPKNVLYLYHDITTSKHCFSLLESFITLLNDFFVTIKSWNPQELSNSLITNMNEATIIITFIFTWPEKFPVFYAKVNERYPIIKEAYDVIHHILNFIKYFYNSIHESIAKCSFQEIIQLMDLVSSVDNKLKSIIDFFQMPFIHNESYPQIIADLNSFEGKFLTYLELKSKLAELAIKTQDSLQENFYQSTKTNTLNAQDRDEFYLKYFAKLQDLKSLLVISHHLDQNIFNFDKSKESLHQHIKEELKKFYVQSIALLSKFPTDNNDYYKEFNMCRDNLRSFSDIYKDGINESIARDYLVQIDGKIIDIFSSKNVEIINALKMKISIQDITSQLIIMKELAVEIFANQDKMNSYIDKTLESIIKTNTNYIAHIGLELAKTESNFAKLLLEHKAFEDYQTLLRNNKTLTFTIDDVLGIKNPRSKNILSGDSIVPKRLKDLYDLFQKKYWKTVDKGIPIEYENDRSMYLESLVTQTYSLITQSDRSIVDPLDIISNIFGYWTLQKLYSKPFNLDNTQNLERNELLQPHAAQLIAIMRLLGLDCLNEQATTSKKSSESSSSIFNFSFLFKSEIVKSNVNVQNHLVQIKTGEGKSITLAVTAITLALLGYRVDCACYSDYLSQRDYNSFFSMFEAFRVRDKIHYGTFNSICETFLNKDINIRHQIETLVSNGHTHKDDFVQMETLRSILLIDEVDVFLSKDFYGSLYRPLAKIEHASIRALIEYLWKNRENEKLISYRTVITSTPYNDCLKVFSKWKELIEECLKAILYDLKTMDNHQYIILNGKIGYPDQDGISFTLNYGYKTMFAYYKEVDTGKLPKSCLEKISYIQLDCGSFAYAAIPQLYDNVLGVTGTLDTLTSKEKAILKDIYEINKNSFIPSMYGDNQRIFRENSSEDVIIESEQTGYNNAITNEIKKRLDSGKRSVLVFFETKNLLNDYYQCAKSFLKNMTILDEEKSNSAKEAIVKQSVTAGNITLLTKAFGRGTDFICYDDQVLKNGGVHVIQSFVSKLVSEETQIMGRTGRQGNKGSYSLVLFSKDLEQFGIDQPLLDQMKKSGELYPKIAKKRDEAFERLFESNMAFVNDIKAQHDISMKFIQEIIQGRDISNTLISLNKRIGLDIASIDLKRHRTLCLMDATGSMTNLLENAKNTVHSMFERTYEILKENNIHDGFELQFAVYRNYSSGAAQLFSASPWTTEPKEISRFMSGVRPSGGLGNEAVEIALHFAVESHKHEEITQIILIGDVPPNTREEVASRRPLSDYSGTPYAVPTYYKDEIKELANLKVPIHCFYLTSGAKSAFDWMSSKTGGVSSELDINSSNGAKVLTDLVTTKVLCGGRSAAVQTKLLNSYEQKYGYCGHILPSN